MHLHKLKVRFYKDEHIFVSFDHSVWDISLYTAQYFSAFPVEPQGHLITIISSCFYTKLRFQPNNFSLQHSLSDMFARSLAALVDSTSVCVKSCVTFQFPMRFSSHEGLVYFLLCDWCVSFSRVPLLYCISHEQPYSSSSSFDLQE